MAPRGVVSRTAREDLLAAATRLLEQGGPRAVTVREIAALAGVATGLLYKHFADLDDLLVALVLERFQEQAARGKALSRSVGGGSVAANLSSFGQRLCDSGNLRLAQVMIQRPDLAGRARDAVGALHTPGLEQIENSVAEYLGAEQVRGRIDPHADPDAASVMLVNGWHRVLLQPHADETIARRRIDVITDTLMRGLGLP